MPILDVEIVGPMLAHVRRDLAQRIADAAGRALESGPQQTWVKVHFLDEERYAENGGPPDEALPVFVNIVSAQLATDAALAAQVSLLTTAIAQACHRPAESVHLVFEPPAAGRISFGGRLRL
jgi:phenylpyruvate tautomerase PptA (4-oxalocrotonate tautomerase family)